MAKHTYQDLYTWSAALTTPSHVKVSGKTGSNDHLSHVMMHTDGSVSMAFTWPGFAIEMAGEPTIASVYQTWCRALASLPVNDHLFLENHWLRQFDDQLAQDYVHYGEQHSVRAKAWGGELRRSIANHIGERSMSNQLLTVLTLRHRLSPWAGLWPRKTQSSIYKRAAQLYQIAQDFIVLLPQARLLSEAEYEGWCWALYHRDRGRAQSIPSPNPRFKLAQRLAAKPQWDDEGLLRLGDTYTKVMWLLDYPDASNGWFYRLARSYGVDIHVSQIIKPMDTGRAIRSSASQTERSRETAAMAGGESESGKVVEHDDFRRFVADNNLSVFGNAYVIKLHHHDKAHLVDTTRELTLALGDEAVVYADDASLAYVYWRVSQPGQGYQTPSLRPDHTWQVANMSPIVRFREGDKARLDMLRLTSDGQAVAFSYPPDGTNHALTGAKTGAGKGVATVAQIAELFPLGVNFYIAEVGASYQWIVESFGGTYFHLDPNTTVVSPFPDFAMAKAKKGEGGTTDRSAEDNHHALDAFIVGTTISALMPLLATQSDPALQPHIASVAEQIMQALYYFHDPAKETLTAPTLATFSDMARETQGNFNGIQAKACQVIIDNLDSFLSSTTGHRFAQANTLDFDSGIVGVNFKPLMNNEFLAKFMLVFIALRYKQLAFANSQSCRIILDELHEFDRIDHDLITTLVKQLTRMGRKEAGAFHGISQEVMDLAMEPGILNQITHRELMYLQSGHQTTADLFDLNETTRARWQAFSDPEAVGSTMDYRECIKMVGNEAYDLHMTFPNLLLDLAHSSPRALALKQRIGMSADNPLASVQALRAAMQEAMR